MKPENQELTYTSNWSGLTGAPATAGFYSGASGSSGTAAGAPWMILTAATGTGTITGTFTLNAEQEAQLLAGNWYYT